MISALLNTRTCLNLAYGGYGAKISETGNRLKLGCERLRGVGKLGVQA